MIFLIFLLGISSFILIFINSLISLLIAIITIITVKIYRKKINKKSILISIGEVLAGTIVLSFIIGLILTLLQ
ncbi:MAG: hypothetical protein PHE54_00065 [Bacilli bacterium]|nr:hypothetical protein [Bacilli bacterium]